MRLSAFVSRIHGSLIDPFLAAVFPARCAECQSWLARPLRGPLCEGCWTSLPCHASEPCHCGHVLAPGLTGPCGRCRRGLSGYELGFSLGPFEGALRTLVHELKFRGRRRVAGRLAELCYHAPAISKLLTPGAALIPVPLHSRRLRERGYNQSALLARALARHAHLPCLTGTLVRRKWTPPQTGLSAAARRANVSDAFKVPRPEVVAQRVIILVDDVFTTGATVRACSQALRRAGAREIRVVTVARVA